MAQKRMFSLSVIDTDKFLEMPVSARLLYYELGMRADDDGFIDNWKKILLFTGLKEDDLKVLIAKQFIIPFETGVIVIKHWRLNNYLQNDRIKPTIHQKEKASLTIDNDNVYKLDTKCIHSIDKNSIEEIRLEENSIAVVVDDSLNNTTTATNELENNTLESAQDLISFTEKIFGRPLGGTEIEIIKTWDTELTRYAIKQAELARAFNIRYIGKILFNYKKDNIKTVAEAEERERRFQESKTTIKNTYKTTAEKNREVLIKAREKIARGEVK